MIKISVVIPVLNEQEYLDAFSQLILKYDYVEFIFVDGGSDDNSVEILDEFKLRHHNVMVIKHNKKITPISLNLAIKFAKGKFICRMDCHSQYPDEYISCLYEKFIEIQKDDPSIVNIGFAVETQARRDSLFSNAVAITLSSKTGMGNSTFRTANWTGRPIKVDTVPFGFFDRKKLEEIGLFDESLPKNQDDELNRRLINSGGSIYLIGPEKIIYFPVDEPMKIAKMFFNYGLYKPISLKKSGNKPSLRHLIPSIFVIICVLLLIAAPMFLLGTMLFYMLAIIMYNDVKKHTIAQLLAIVVCHLIVHICYGTGFLRGVLKL